MREFGGMAEIKHLNIRKQGEEGTVLAVDVKMTMSVSASVVDDLMCEGINEGTCLSAFWLGSEDMAPTFPQIEEIGFARQYKNVRADLLGITLSGCEIKKFRLSPRTGRNADLTFQLTMTEPPARAVDLLASALANDTWVSLTSEQGELPLTKPVSEVAEAA